MQSEQKSERNGIVSVRIGIRSELSLSTKYTCTDILVSASRRILSIKTVHDDLWCWKPRKVYAWC